MLHCNYAGLRGQQPVRPRHIRRSTTARLLQPSPTARRGLTGKKIIIGDIPREPLSHSRREILLAELERTLASEGLCSLLGSRGVGKTHLAATYARDYLRATGKTVVWIVAEDRVNVIRSLAELARRAGVVEEVVDIEPTAKAALRWLEQLTESSLIVLDNAVDPDLVAPWLPQRGTTHVLITSTNQDFAILGGVVQVGVFTESQAVAFLCARSGCNENADALTVARELGLLPLALAQAGWVIRKRQLSFADYLAGFRVAPLESVLVRVPGEDYPRSVEETTNWSLAEVEAIDSTGLVRSLLDFIALLTGAGVRRELLYLLTPSRIDIDTALGTLSGASLIGFDLSGGTVTMHRLTQRVVLNRARREGRLRDAAASAVATLALAVDSSTRPHTDTPTDVVDHITNVWTLVRDLLVDDSPHVEPLASLLRLRRWSVARLTAAGELHKAVSLGVGNLAEHESLLPVDHQFTGEARRILLDAYIVGNRWDGAIDLAEQTLDERNRLFGLDDERTIDARNRLGYCCECGGRLHRAAEIHLLNLTESIRVCGLDNQNTLKARINLASTYRSVGLLDKAIEVFEENLRENIRVHGEDHPSIINARGELARSYVRAGRADDGIALHEKNATLLNHYDEYADPIWWSQYLAAAYSATGRHDDALRLLWKLLELSEDRLPQDHPRNIRLRLFLARALLASGRTEEAIALFERTAAERERVLGADHPASLNARRNLGLALTRTGKITRAREVLKLAVADYERGLGTDHPFTPQARDDLEGLLP